MGITASCVVRMGFEMPLWVPVAVELASAPGVWQTTVLSTSHADPGEVQSQ